MDNVEIVDDFINELQDFELNKETIEVANAWKDILAERKADKKKLKELEKENYLQGWIPKQKVKDFINKLKLSGGSNGKDNEKIIQFNNSLSEKYGLFEVNVLKNDNLYFRGRITSNTKSENNAKLKLLIAELNVFYRKYNLKKVIKSMIAYGHTIKY